MVAGVRNILLVQLPIPPVGPEPIRGNVPLAAGYLKLMARLQELEPPYRIELLPTSAANYRSDQGLVEEILVREPWLVGFTCYLWNIDRTLWIAQALKARRPELLILLGGPEITADNNWVLAHPAVDYAAIGEGEQTFCDLLRALAADRRPATPIDGLFVCGADGSRIAPGVRRPLPRLDEISSPYLAGILDATEEAMLLLETIRGCVFKCKFCYYPKSYDGLYFLSRGKIEAHLEHARERGVREVVLLDPTLNQRRDFNDFLRLLAEGNTGRGFTYFGELRAEGITDQTASLLRAANFTEVEVGLQSIDPLAMDLMDRTNNLRAFERGCRAMLEQGIRVKVDLIIGLPGDTVASVRRGMDYLHTSGLYSSVQVFNLAVLPGTAFRQEASQLGLAYSQRTPYYVYRTPTLSTADLYELMQEAEELFDVEFDPLPPPALALEPPAHLPAGMASSWLADLDASAEQPPPPAAARAQAFTLWLRSSDFGRDRSRAIGAVRRLLSDNPHTTLEVILEPQGNPNLLTPATLEALRAACCQETSYLDRFYSIQPGRWKGAKRLVVALASTEQGKAANEWLGEIGEYATVSGLEVNSQGT
jgi:radical SAM superfamily enzyme YgiQ (UPF0313 family)